MSDSTIVILVSSGQAIILAVLTSMVKIWSDRQDLNAAKQAANHEQTTQAIKVLKEQTDGKLDALIEAATGKANAEGQLTGRADVRAETKEDAK